MSRNPEEPLLEEEPPRRRSFGKQLLAVLVLAGLIAVAFWYGFKRDSRDSRDSRDPDDDDDNDDDPDDDPDDQDQDDCPVAGQRRNADGVCFQTGNSCPGADAHVYNEQGECVAAGCSGENCEEQHEEHDASCPDGVCDCSAVHTMTCADGSVPVCNEATGGVECRDDLTHLAWWTGDTANLEACEGWVVREGLYRCETCRAGYNMHETSESEGQYQHGLRARCT